MLLQEHEPGGSRRCEANGALAPPGKLQLGEEEFFRSNAENIKLCLEEGIFNLK